MTTETPWPRGLFARVVESLPALGYTRVRVRVYSMHGECDDECSPTCAGVAPDTAEWLWESVEMCCDETDLAAARDCMHCVGLIWARRYAADLEAAEDDLTPVLHSWPGDDRATALPSPDRGPSPAPSVQRPEAVQPPPAEWHVDHRVRLATVRTHLAAVERMAEMVRTSTPGQANLCSELVATALVDLSIAIKGLGNL